MRYSRLVPCLTALVLSVMAAGAQTTPPASTDQSGVTGAIQLPQGPPPTGPQGALPAPVFATARPDQPVATSPTLKAISARLATLPLTFNDAISIALATNPTLALAGQALYRAQGRTAEEGAALNPTLGAGTGETYLHSELQPVAFAAATLPLDISGLLHAATDQAHFEEVTARLDVNRTRNQIVFNVKSAFYNLLRAEALVSVATENMQNSLDRLKDANLKYQQQAVAYFDVIRAQTDVADAQRQIIQARNGVSLNTSNLANAMGIEVTTPLRVTQQGAVEEPPGVPPPTVPPLTPGGDIPPSGTGNGASQPAPEPSAVAPPPANLTAPQPDAVIDSALKLGPEFHPVLDEALGTRPEILEGDANIAAARKGILIARRSQLPSLDLGAGYFYIRNTAGTTRINEPQVRLAITIPLYDGGLARAREQEARSDVATAITTRRQAVDAVTLDVQQAYLNLVQARDEVAVANQALAQARESFQIARTRYNAGVASHAGLSPLLEVSDAQAALTLAESNQVNALYDYNDARAQLDRAVGRFAYIGNGPGYAKTPSAQTVGRTTK